MKGVEIVYIDKHVGLFLISFHHMIIPNLLLKAWFACRNLSWKQAKFVWNFIQDNFYSKIVSVVFCSSKFQLLR